MSGQVRAQELYIIILTIIIMILPSFKLFSLIGSNLLGVIKYGIEISKAPATREFPKDLAEELLWINVAGLSAPVVLPSSSLTGIKARCAVRIVLLPFDFITQDLRGDKFTF